MKSPDEDHRRLYWRSRRGMLELELKLLPFVTQRYQHLPADAQRAYAQLLECEDWEIYDWLQARETPPPQFSDLVVAINEWAAHPARRDS